MAFPSIHTAPPVIATPPTPVTDSASNRTLVRIEKQLHAIRQLLVGVLLAGIVVAGAAITWEVRYQVVSHRIREGLKRLESLEQSGGW